METPRYRGITRISNLVDSVNEGVGRAVSWLTLVMVLLTFAIVVLRYGFNLGWIWLQESLTYLHVAVFSIACAWALQEDAHVRVDILLEESDINSVLDTLRSTTRDIEGNGIYWVTAVEQNGRL